MKKSKVRNLEALQALDAGMRADALGEAGLSAEQVGDVEEALQRKGASRLLLAVRMWAMVAVAWFLG